MRLVRGARRRLRLWQTDLSSLKRFVMFVGNPRSGTTLVRSLLNAHPEVVNDNEVDVLRCVRAEETWETVLGRILQNESEFSAKPVWTGYDYRVQNAPSAEEQPRSPKLRVIGDKKAGASSKWLRDNPSVLAQFTEWSRLPNFVIHCVRHPFDVISTKTRRNGESLDVNIDRYFESEMTAVALENSHQRVDYVRLYQEDLIQDASTTLTSLLHAIGLDVPTGYVGACEALVYEKPNRSRFKVKWTEDLILDVERRVRKVPHLHRYLHDGRLLFDEAAGQTYRSTSSASQPLRRAA